MTPKPTITTAGSTMRELDHRSGDGVQVTLLWSAETNRVFVSVVELRNGASFQFEVAPAAALDAFHHPYAYAEHRRRPDVIAA